MCIDVNVFLLFSNPGLSSLDGVVYCIGGSNGSTGSKVCFKLKPGSPKWQRIADLHIGKTIVPPPRPFTSLIKCWSLNVFRSLPSCCGCIRRPDLGSGRLRELESLEFLGNLRASDRHLEHWTFVKHSQARLWSGCSQR